MIVVVGIAGAGKSVQSEMLARKLKCEWVGAGRLLRAKMGEREQQKMLSGELLDDDITIGVLEEAFAHIDAAHREFVLDGCPRTLRQAEWLHGKLERRELTLTTIIHLLASETAAERRLLSRGRPDDYEAAISERFREYEQTIKPIITYFRERGLTVHDIDGEQTVEEVHGAIMAVLGH